ncbi:MAG: helix-turn-helix domain-containing protein, partial [Deltaproteobacteria bacterium]|nr:helix-turn-helix domain-containing protein [Deltaproteobacteria bacterium]
MIDTAPWVNRSHPGSPTVPLLLSDADRAALLVMLRSQKLERRVYVRGQALLMMADGVATCDVARLLGIHERTAFEWRARFTCDAPLSKL